MGTTAHVAALDASAGWFDAVEQRLHQLEARWSRFLPSSDICTANARIGAPTPVAPETAALVATALGWSTSTNGLFEPAILEALVAAGYDRSFELLGDGGALADRRVTRLPAASVDLAESTITVHAPIDLGGIGKGAAADQIATELGDQVVGGCVNLGGDLRAWGQPPDGIGWHVAVDVPGHADLVVSVVEGALATSSVERRRWRTADGRDAHHLIDPRTGRPATSDLRAVTVVDCDATTAEVLAKAALVAGCDAAHEVLGGAPALLRADDGDVLAVNGMEAYLS